MGSEWIGQFMWLQVHMGAPAFIMIGCHIIFLYIYIYIYAAHCMGMETNSRGMPCRAAPWHMRSNSAGMQNSPQVSELLSSETAM